MSLFVLVRWLSLAAASLMIAAVLLDLPDVARGFIAAPTTAAAVVVPRRSMYSSSSSVTVVVRSSSSSNANEEVNQEEQDDDDDDTSFMASLRSRLEQVQDQETKLPLVVLDCMLPRQVLKIQVQNQVFLELVRTRLKLERPVIGMLGVAKLANGQLVHLNSGVQVEIVGQPQVVDDDTDGTTLQLTLRGDKCFKIVGEVDTAPQGWTEARVQFLNDNDDADQTTRDDDRVDPRIMLSRAISKAKELTPLVETWIGLAKEKERQPGQIARLLQDLGDMPDAEQHPTDCALWVGALINPLPAMGVALEIRPQLLLADNAENRVDIALQGIQKSIRHMQGEPLLS